MHRVAVGWAPSTKKSCKTVLFIALVIFLAFTNAYSQDTIPELRFKDADLTDVIRMLSEMSGYNIVVGSDVSGKVTFELRNVTARDALEAALKINGYGIEKMGEIMFVRPFSKIEGKDQPSYVSVPPRLVTKSYKVTYIDVTEVASTLKENISKYGKITANKSNNIIVVEDIEEYVNRVETVIKNLDVVPKQVLIEARMLEIRLSNETQLGVDWKQVFKGGDASFDVQGANFSIPPSAGTPGLFFNVITPHFEMFLDALQQKGDLKTLATPKLLTLDNKEAEIIIGGRLGYRVTTTINQVTTESVEFLDIGTMLKLTPRISDDGNILLSIHPEVSDGEIIQGLPSETTTEVTTKVLVRDGESIFIGGLIRDRKEKSVKQIPLLGSIPILGHLFKRSTDIVSRSETIIVITPHIVDLKSADIFQQEKGKVESFESGNSSSGDIK